MKRIRYIYTNPLNHLQKTEYLYDKLENRYQAQSLYRYGGRAFFRFQRLITAIRKKLQAAERANYLIRTKWEMLLNPVHRRLVLKDLGGEAALLRWERRRKRLIKFRYELKKARDLRRRLKDARRRSGRPESPDLPPTKRTKRRGVKTDRSGRFCLAPAIDPPIRHSFWRSYDRHNATRRPYKPPLIPLRPDELRGDILMGLGLRRDGTEFVSGAIPLLKERSREHRDLRARNTCLSALEPMAGGTCPAIPTPYARPTSSLEEVKKGEDRSNEKPP